MPESILWVGTGIIDAACIAAIFWPLPKDVRRYKNVTRKPLDKP